MKRVLLLALVFLLLAGVGLLAWRLAGLPPVGFVLRYGLSYGCEPTGETVTIEGVEFVEIGPGCFRMGSTHLAEGGDVLGKLCAAVGLPWGDQPGSSLEMPVHWVEFEDGFWIARNEVTNLLYEQFDPEHERSDRSDRDTDPVVLVTWAEAKAYCSWLAAGSGLPVRLPSEAEWESACRAGTDTEFSFGDSEQALSGFGWFDGNSDGRAHRVASLRPNAWGLHDMHGNVWEWCEDTDQRHYEGAPRDGSAWTKFGPEWQGRPPNRMKRGGGWCFEAEMCRSAQRAQWGHDAPYFCLGFRPAFEKSSE